VLDRQVFLSSCPARRASSTAPQHSRCLRVGSVKPCPLTPHAADGGYVARFSSFFAAWAFLRFDGESTLPPTAANAHRWAAELVRGSRFFDSESTDD